jgi:putative transposase
VVEHAIWTRGREGVTDLSGLIHHNDRGSQYTSGRVHRAINGLYKTELINPQGPWPAVDQVEVATLEWVDWFNHRRLYEHCDDLPPAEYEALYHRQHRTQPTAEFSNQ